MEETITSFDLQKTLVITFLLVTVTLTITISYSVLFYFDVYRGVQNFRVTIEDFSVNVSNASYVLTATSLTINNPSTCTFEVAFIEERLYLKERFILIEPRYMYENPMQMEPYSNRTMTIEAEIPQHLLDYVMDQSDEEWAAQITLLLTAPLVGQYKHRQWFSLDTSTTWWQAN